MYYSVLQAFDINITEKVCFLLKYGIDRSQCISGKNYVPYCPCTILNFAEIHPSGLVPVPGMGHPSRRLWSRFLRSIAPSPWHASTGSVESEGGRGFEIGQVTMTPSSFFHSFFSTFSQKTSRKIGLTNYIILS